MRLFVASLLLVSCHETTAGYFGTVAPKHDRDILWINNSSEPEWIDPGKCSDAVGGDIIWTMFAGLTEGHPETLKPMPDLARRWEVSDDGLRYTFHLRPSAWSDGKPLTAHDFEWSWKRVADSKTASKYASIMYPLRNADAFHQKAVHVRGLPAGVPESALRHFVEQHAPIERIKLVEKRGESVEPASTERGPSRSPQSIEAFVFLAGEPDAKSAARERLLAALAQEPFEERLLAATTTTAAAVGVRALDDLTLEVELETPVPYFLNLTNFYTFMPVPRHVIERLALGGENPDLWTRPEHIVTSGAYKLVEWKFRQYLLFEKNPHYWDAANTKTPWVKFFEVESYNTTLNMYRAGEFDWIGSSANLPSEFMPHLEPYKDFHRDPFLAVYFYWINTKAPPMDNPKVRRAFSMALDRSEIVRFVTKGGQIPSADLVPDGLAGYQGLKQPVFDPEGARRLLAEAGYPGGQGFPNVSVTYNTSEGHKYIAEAAQQMWKKHLGVRVNIENQEWKVYLNNLKTNNFQIGRMGWVGDYADPNTFLEILSRDSGNNHSGWSSPEYDELLRRANAVSDPTRRLEILRQAEELAMVDQPLIPFYVYTRSHMYKPYLRGMWGNYSDRHLAKYMWIDTDWTPGDPVPVDAAPSREQE